MSYLKTINCIICGNKLNPKQRICCSKECAKERQRQVWRAYYKNNSDVRLRKAEACKRRRDATSKRNQHGFGICIKNPFPLNDNTTIHERRQYFILKYS